MKKILLILLLLITPLTVNAESHYLYDVLKNEAESNGLAKEYTGEHHDSFTKEPSKKIYHWYAENDEEGNQVLEKNNIIFANFCWQIIRTTDTGGVKLIYNGIPNEGKCTNNGNDTTIGISLYNENYKSMAYAGYMYNPDSIIISKRADYTPSFRPKFSSSVSYSDNNYSLVNTSDSLNNTHHYGCKNGSNICSTISYFFHLSNGEYIYYDLENGQTIESIIEDMTKSSNVNQEDSVVKEYIDNWYNDNLINYTSDLEDTIFCNNRNIIDLGGMNPSGGDTTYSRLKYSEYSNDSNLLCEYDTDKFSLSNNMAKLKYPIGLMTKAEMLLLNNNNIRKNGTNYYLTSPNSYYLDSVYLGYINSTGSIETYYRANQNISVRPSVSLKTNSRYSSGDGSKNNPYIFDTSNYYKVIVDEPTKKGDIEFETEDISNIEEGEEVKFKIIPVKGYELKDLSIIDEEDNDVDYKTTDNINFKFTMPATDVTIKPQYKEIESNIINPNTGRQILLIIISVIILSVMIFIFIKKKKRLT